MAHDQPGQSAAALWYDAPEHAGIRAETLAAANDGDLLVRALFSGISRGTESLVFGGRVPVSEYERMRAPFMSGGFPFPVKYGYAMVGRVEDGPPALLGRTVFSLHPHQTLFRIPAASAVVVPDHVPPQRAVLAANMETALNALWDAAPGPADRIAVVGAGVVGALVAWLCGRLPGTEVTLVDINPDRAALARALGVDFATPGKATGECDLVVHASGRPEGLSTALALAGDEATVLELSWYGETPVTASLGGAFHSRRLRLVSSQVGRIAPSHRPRWSYARRLAAAIGLLADPALDALLMPPIAFGALPPRLPEIFDARSGVLCQPISYP